MLEWSRKCAGHCEIVGPSNVFWAGVRVVWEGFLEEVAVKLEPEVRVR